MIEFSNVKEWMNLGIIRAHLCTTSAAVGLQVLWRSPRDAFRYGGLQYGITFTLAMILIALPLTLLQLAIGQLSQQDAIGVWRAVPFFRGIGYIKLMTSFVAAVYSVTYVALTITYFFHGISNSMPFQDCSQQFYVDYQFTQINASACLDATFMSPVFDNPEYYLPVAFLLLGIWIVFPFIFYNPVKYMKRIFYVLGPIVTVMAIVIAACIGNGENLATFVQAADWERFLEPNIWHAALVQVLLSSQIAGGYLISASDTVYCNRNVIWTAIAFVAANVFSTWFGLLFWFSITEANRDTSVFAVLIETYKMGERADLNVEWPLLIFFLLILSGGVTMLSLLFPIYDHCHRIAGLRWRVVSMIGSLVGASVSIATLAFRNPAFTLLDDYAVPLLVTVSVVPEILAFVFIYDWRMLVEDVEFLTSHELAKYWVIGWGVAPCILLPVTVWWFIIIYLRDDSWLEPPWPAITLIVTFGLASFTVLCLSIMVVARQVQYNIIGKLKSAFCPSRHWGPRDPIAHYYWLARRHDLVRQIQTDRASGIRYSRRTELVLRPTDINVTYFVPEYVTKFNVTKERSNSDDWIFTIQRKEMVTSEDDTERARSMSLDFNLPVKKSEQSKKSKLNRLQGFGYETPSSISDSFTS